MSKFHHLDLSFALKEKQRISWERAKELASFFRFGLFIVIIPLILSIDWEKTSLYAGGGLIVFWTLLLVSSVWHGKKK